MPATVEFDETNGVGAVKTHGVKRIDFGSVDQADLQPAENQIQIGGRSYSKYISIHFYGTYNSISDVKIWLEASNRELPSGVSLKYKTTNIYTAPSTDDINGVDIPTSEPASSNVNVGVSESTATGSSTTSNPAYTEYIVLQLQLPTVMDIGMIPPIEIKVKYTET